MSGWGARSNIMAVMRAINQAAKDAEKAMAKKNLDLAARILKQAKENAPVDTGALRRSGRIETKGPTTSLFSQIWVVFGGQGTGVDYACVFNAHTTVTLSEKTKTIGQIKVGDEVISQDGNAHKVIRTYKFPTTKKPDLVTIVSKWRKGTNHEVTLTQDHKILSMRNNVIKWIPAGELTTEDFVFHRKKKPYNKGVYKHKQKVCKNCGKKHRSQGKKFCSQDCRLSYWGKGHNPHIGMKRSDETKKRISDKAKDRIKNNPENALNRIIAKKGFVSDIEKKIKSFLEINRSKFIMQYNVGNHFVDFYLPEEDTIIEADGAYWHQDQISDVERDKEIKALMPDTTIFHIHFKDPRFSPDKLNVTPLDGVYYMVLNPSMKSFVNLSIFEPTPILETKKFKYEPPKTPHSSDQSNLYDVGVEDVHSFLANGIIVSNTFVELGTSYQQGQFYLLRAVREFAPKFLPANKEGFEEAWDKAVLKANVSKLI